VKLQDLYTYQHFVESQIKENRMGLACDMYLGKRKIYTD